MISSLSLFALSLAPATTLCSAAVPTEHAAERLVIFAERAFTQPGEVVENATIIVEDGKITSVRGGTLAGDADLRAACVTAGLVDMSFRYSRHQNTVEQSAEITAAARITPMLDLHARGWERALRQGITTVAVFPVDRNVVGGQGAVLKTGGEATLEARLLRADAFLRGAMGSEPSSGNRSSGARPANFYARRPTTRMGVEWEWRKAFYDAWQAEQRGEEPDANQAELLRALSGETPVFIQAWATQDIRTAVFFAEEMAAEGMGTMRLIIDAGAEAWREPDLLVRSKAAVCLPPLPAAGRTTERAFMSMNTAAKLHAAGVPVALSAHGNSGSGNTLAEQVFYARRGGLPFDAALAAVTTVPATLLGVSDRVGTIADGRDADLVLWNGTPFELTSRPVGVVLNGVTLIGGETD
jgi:imidazolonepropionase-like amidohydrolase